MSNFNKLVDTFRDNIKKIESITDSPGAIDKASSAVPFFYYFLLMTAVGNASTWKYFLERGNFDPIWPLFWFRFFENEISVIVVSFFFLACSVIASFFFWNIKGRIIGFLGIWQYHALKSSFGQPDHEWYLFVFVALIFIFFPDIWKMSIRTEAKKKFLLIFWAAQSFVLLTYSMSGLQKLTTGITQLLQGETSIFSPNSAALQIASFSYFSGREGLLGSIILEYPVLGWLPFLLVLYLELFAFYVAFHPSLQRIWALGLVVFLHIGSILSMGLIFQPPVFILLMLFFNSPFAPSRANIVSSVKALPLIGRIFSLIAS